MSDAPVPPPPVSDTMVAGALGALRESIEDLRKRPVALDPDALKSVIRAALAEATAPPPNLLVTAIRRLELVERRLESLEQAVRSGGATLSRTSPVVSETPAPTVLPALDAEALADALARRLAAAASLGPPAELGSFAPSAPPLDAEAVATRVAQIVAGHLQALPSAPQQAPVVDDLTERIRSVVAEVFDERQPAVAADAGAASEIAITAALVPVVDVLARVQRAIEEATTPVEAVAAVSRLEAGVSALAEALEDDREHQAKLVNAGFDEIGERVERLSDEHPERIGHIAEAVAETRSRLEDVLARLEGVSPAEWAADIAQLKDSVAAQTAHLAALPSGPNDDEVLQALETLKSYLEELSSRPSMLSEVYALRGEIESVRELIAVRSDAIDQSVAAVPAPEPVAPLLDAAMTALEHRLAERFDLAVSAVVSQTAAFAEAVAGLDTGDDMKDVATSLSRVVATAHDLSSQVALIKERMDANAAAIELSRRAADAGEGARSAVHGMRTDLAAQLATWSATLDQAAARLAALIESSTAVLAERLDTLNNTQRR